ncbi:hypothetical protein [Modestobacter sp. KNN46-3]|uniref:hypothetical protein n=1 Tax=Modestobacter sp. KNN46-3 TaxID=2711218 RepID=UPI0013E0C937|nr:hypothetical protein [Modestobacter sp. KNN46-3]
MAGYGTPKDTTDATARAGHLAPAVNALGYAVDDLDARLTETTATADSAKSVADSAKSKNDSQDGRLDSLSTRVDGVADDVRELKQVALNPVPRGGRTGQALRKRSSADFDLVWSDIPGSTTPGGNAPLPAGGVAGEVLTKDSDANGHASWQKAKGGGGGGGVVGTVVDYNGLLNTATVRYADGDGVTVVASFARNASSFSLSTGDTVGLVLPLTETGPVIIAGVISRVSGYTPVAQGPFSVHQGYPVRQGQTDPMRSVSGRDHGNVLGLGPDLLVGGGYRFYNPTTGLYGTLPTPPADAGTIVGSPFFAFGKLWAVGSTGGTQLAWFNPATWAWEVVATPTGGAFSTTNVGGYMRDGKLWLVRRDWSGSTSSGTYTFHVHAFDGTTWTTVATPAVVINGNYSNPQVRVGGGALWFGSGSRSSSTVSSWSGALASCTLATGAWVVHSTSNSSPWYEAVAYGCVADDGTLWSVGSVDSTGKWAPMLSNAEGYSVWLTRFGAAGGRAASQWISAIADNGGPDGSMNVKGGIEVRPNGPAGVLICGVVNLTTHLGQTGYGKACAIWATDGSTTSRVWQCMDANWGLVFGEAGTAAAPIITMSSLVPAPEAAGRYLWMTSQPANYAIYDGTV